MKYTVLLAATAVLALAACKKSEEAVPGAASSEAAAVPSDAAAVPSDAAPTAVTAGTTAFTAGEAPSKEFMVGIWGEGEACKLPINFQADGTIKDGPFEKWSLENGELSMEGAPQKLKLKVIDEKTLESTLDGGKPLVLKRCG